MSGSVGATHTHTQTHTRARVSGSESKFTDLFSKYVSMLNCAPSAHLPRIVSP